MHNLLAAAGLGQDILSLIPAVVDTCRECRNWQAPARQTIPAIRLSIRFNQHVEVDLLFYRHFVVLHFIDRCTRFHAGASISSKEENVLLSTVRTAWVTHHGPMEIL